MESTIMHNQLMPRIDAEIYFRLAISTKGDVILVFTTANVSKLPDTQNRNNPRHQMKTAISFTGRKLKRVLTNTAITKTTANGTPMNSVGV